MDGRLVLVRHTCDGCHATAVRYLRQSDPNAESGSPIIVSGRTDADLVAEATGGDIEAFAELSRRYSAVHTLAVALQSEVCLPDSSSSRSWWREQRERSSSFMPIATESGTRLFGLGSSSSF